MAAWHQTWPVIQQGERPAKVAGSRLAMVRRRFDDRRGSGRNQNTCKCHAAGDVH
jgi:hypothetical protein